jgi:hypothetical protein
LGYPVVARPAALIPLRHALRTGQVQLIPETMVTKVLLGTSGATGRATGVNWIKMTERGPVTGVATADIVVLAASAGQICIHNARDPFIRRSRIACISWLKRRLRLNMSQ